MPNIAQINDTQVSIVKFKSVPIITTEQLANFYGTESVRIRQNQHENKSRFIEGKHFFKIAGQELKDFVSSLKLLANFPAISKKTRSLILWTERGAARHAKMLDTDQAWDIFEQLEDCYFHRQEILAKTHKSERTALHDAHALLVAKTKHLNSSDAWKIINQRFGTKSIDEIPYDQIPVAVEYVHHLIALYSGASKQGSLFDDELYREIYDICLDALATNQDHIQLLHNMNITFRSDTILNMINFTRKENTAIFHFARKHNLLSKQGNPLISKSGYVEFYNGGGFSMNRNYFV